MTAALKNEACLHTSASSIVASLKSCVRSKDWIRALAIHEKINRSESLKRNCIVGSTLVDMYAKFGSPAKAKEVFDSLQVHDVISWTSVISGYAEKGQGEMALDCFEQMKLEGIYPDAFTFVCTMKACGTTADIDKGRELHSEIERMGLLQRNHFVGSAVIDMYKRCGLISAAEHVFHSLSNCDVITWNTLLTAYIDSGLSQKAVVCYEKMKKNGMSPNTVTFLCILKACGNIQAGIMGDKLHIDIERKGFLENNQSLGNALVDMFCKCGNLVKAREVFQKLVARDVMSWNTLLSRYVENYCCEEALDCFGQMQQEGILPSAVTLSCSLKACSILRDIRKGLQIHTMVERKLLLGNDLVLGTILVDMYSKCGLNEKAEEVLKELPVHDVCLWTTLIGGFTEQGLGKEALTCYERMQAEGVCPSNVTFVCCLKACRVIGALNKGTEVHVEVERQGLVDKDPVIGSVIVDMYASHGLIDKAEEVFDKIPIRNVVSWTALIAGYVEFGYSNKALDCYELMQLEGVSPNSSTILSILKASGSLGAISNGRLMHTEIEKLELCDKDTFVGNALIDMYAECDSIAEALKIFDMIQNRSVVSWNSLIAAYVEYGQGKEALEFFEQMRVEGVLPNHITIVCILKACKNIGAVNIGEQIQSQFDANDYLHISPAIGSTLVAMYATCGKLDRAKEVFEKLRFQNPVSWNVLIGGCAEHGYSEEAIRYYEQMQFHGISPDAITYVYTLEACRQLGSIDKGVEVHAEIESKGLSRTDSIVGNTLIHMYAKNGLLHKAHEVFENLPVPSVVSWTALMSGYVELGKSNLVLEIFDQMVQEHVTPDPFSFTVVLSACSQVGLFNKSVMFFEAMHGQYGLCPTIEHRNCIIDLLGRSGQLKKALMLVNRVSFCSDPVVWKTLLGACRNLGSLEVGKFIFQHLVITRNLTQEP